MNSNNNSYINASDKSSQQVSRDFKGIWIPREIWLHPELSPLEKLLWSEVHSLYDRERGGCYASNTYLYQFLGIKERHLQEMMSHLKELGLIEQVSFDGRTRIIKAILPKEDFSPDVCAPQRCSTVHPSGAEKCTPAGHSTAPLSIIYNKDKNKEECVGQSPTPTHKKTSAAPKKKPPKEPAPEKTKYGEYVAMTPEQHADRLMQYGAEKLQWMINYLDERIAINPAAAKKWSSHYHVLSPSQWVHAEYEKRQSPDTNGAPARNFNSRPSAASAHANSQIAQNAKYKYDSGCCTLAIEEKNVIFIPHHGVNPDKTFLSLYDPNFEERFEQLLKRFGFR